MLTLNLAAVKICNFPISIERCYVFMVFYILLPQMKETPIPSTVREK